MKSFTIGKKIIRENSDVFTIAEAGVNHNGDLKIALQLVDVAADAGADAVKFQTFKAEQLVTKRGEMAAYQKKNIGTTMSQREMLQRLELNENFYGKIIERCKKRGILFLSTPHGGLASVRFLETLHTPAYKVGSGDLTNYILLKKLATSGKPVILSSGMATLREVKESIDFIKKQGNRNIAMLHCTTNYPCPPEEVNLMAMQTLMNELDVPVGYSDHTVGLQVAIMAATLGAAIYECHFTLDKGLPGPDHIASNDPTELKKKIEAIRKVKVIIGEAKKSPTRSEMRMIRTVRKSVVAIRDIPKGKKISETDLEAKRPGDGLSPTKFKDIIGKKAKRHIYTDEQIIFKDIMKK